MVPEARNIPRTSETVNKRLKLKSEACSTEVVSVFIELLIAIISTNVSCEFIFNNVCVWLYSVTNSMLISKKVRKHTSNDSLQEVFNTEHAMQ